MSFALPKNSPLKSKDFTYGVATASFQIEGATEEGGRCESIWDRFCATPGKVLNGDDGSVACDHYHRMDADLDLIKSLGVDAYRFSVAWPRIEPRPGEWNEEGFAFYEKLIDGLIKRGIKPFMTLYHWDLPQYLEDHGGWINRETAYRFAEYADKVSARFGNKVASYATLNEPWCSAFLGYRFGVHAPGLKSDRLGFQAMHHLLLAHGLAIPLMRKNAPKAEHGIVLNFTPAYPATDTGADHAVVDFYSDEHNHSFLQPLLEAKYPTQVFEKHPDWEPTMVPGDLDIMATKIDFLGVNFYSRSVITSSESRDYDYVSQEAPKTDIGWEIYPAALTELLVGFKEKYRNLPPIFITENGAADNTECVDAIVDDNLRTDYYQRHLNAVHNAVEQGVNIKGYFAWSLMDNFEWAWGYSQRFGIVHVNYDTQVRTVKKSGKTWQAFLAER